MMMIIICVAMILCLKRRIKYASSSLLVLLARVRANTQMEAAAGLILF